MCPDRCVCRLSGRDTKHNCPVSSAVIFQYEGFSPIYRFGSYFETPHSSVFATISWMEVVGYQLVRNSDRLAVTLDSKIEIFSQDLAQNGGRFLSRSQKLHNIINFGGVNLCILHLRLNFKIVFVWFVQFLRQAYKYWQDQPGSCPNVSWYRLDARRRPDRARSQRFGNELRFQKSGAEAP